MTINRRDTLKLLGAAALPAPAIVPAFSASTSAASSTMGPRAVLTRKALCFIDDSCAAPMRWCVAGLYGQLRLTTSLEASSSACDMKVAPSSRSTAPSTGLRFA